MFLYWSVQYLQGRTVKFKSPMIDFNQIIGPVEAAIVSWAQHCPLTTPLTTIQDLTNAELFIYFLKRVPYFAFAEPCAYGYSSELALGERIIRMKLIGRSILAHYKCQMGKDFGETHFNYVEMCTGNREELIRLVIMFMGIIVSNVQVLQELEDYISSSEEQSVAYMKIMVDYAKRMSEREEENDSPLKKQKRLIVKLENLEEQVEFYEEYTKQLEAKIEKLSEEAEKAQRVMGENTASAAQMLRRIEELQTTHEELNREISKKASSEELLNAKLAKNRQMADETMNKLIKDIEKEQEETIYYKKLVLKYEHVEALNRELATTNSELTQELLALKAKHDRVAENLSKKEAEIETIGKTNNELSLENDSLKLKIELIEKSFTHNRSIHFSPEQKSIVVHNPLDLSTPNHHNFAWFNFREREMERSHMADSLTLTLKSTESFVQNRMRQAGMLEGKENNINCANVTLMPQSECNINNIAEQKSFELDMNEVSSLMQMKSQRDIQFEFAIQMMAEMHDHMEDLRRQLKKYQLQEAKKLSRALLFRNKVNTMFQ